MSNMKKLPIIYTVFILLLVSCSREQPLKDIDTQAFRNDTGACNDIRTQIHPEVFAAREELMGLREADLRKLLGRPDYQELGERSAKFYFYRVAPGRECDETIDKAALTLQVRFSALGGINEISYKNYR